ncbi:MAG: AAA family ATPase [Defluviicoccus sp.]|nr:AAA family ATPase [Defluviicoccus sp.]MDE0275360.1 AAA family ATPase [Defluviicoccus sp.]
MLNAYQRRLLLSYIANAAERLVRRHPVALELVIWVVEHAGHLGIKPDRDAPRRRPRRRWEPPDDGPGLTKKVWAGFREALRDGIRSAGNPGPDLTARRLRRLADIAPVRDTDIRILECLLLYETSRLAESLIDDVFRGVQRRGQFNVGHSPLPYVLDLSPQAAVARLGPDAPLVRSGLVAIDEDGDLSVARRLIRLASVPGKKRDIRDLLLGKPGRAELEWSDFDHLAADRDHAVTLLEGALRAPEKGVNILFHGPPGTGKTQFCRTLADKLGVPLFDVGERDERGGEPDRAQRLGDLTLAHTLLAGDRNALVLFDETVDLLPGNDLSFLFGGFGRRTVSGGSKLFMNRLLENAPVPTLWTANTSDRVPEAFLRRMKFALELRLPPPRIRARIWSRQLARNGIEAGPDDALSLARDFEAPPGVAAEVAAAARLTGGDMVSVRRGLRGLTRALSRDRPVQRAPASFDLSLIRSDTDPAGLAERLEARGERGFSVCLQGPPGTGKSAWVRHLADRLGLEVMQKRASDLLSPWVGGTEANIAAAFREARDNEAFLIFDEAESLLADRRHAERNWEVSQTNEMLTWMESHPLPFACTTNFADRLDPATLRRFVFKIALGYLAREQAEAAFRTFFDLEAPPSVADLANLTPGDFATVRRKADILGCLAEPETLAGMLKEECEAKPGHRRPIGFRA